ncbi:hypothetical protein I4U23_009384 [Adineta vaga]|nr:hypothetical protein I4U23_009384 [Adineta vaga]
MHDCGVESYNETVYLRNCLNYSISIQTTRCRGHCYSEEHLVYDWRHTSGQHRYKHNVHCCSPSATKSHETHVLCQNKQFQAIKYYLVTQCECKRCSDRCSEYL